MDVYCTKCHGFTRWIFADGDYKCSAAHSGPLLFGDGIFMLDGGRRGADRRLTAEGYERIGTVFGDVVPAVGHHDMGDVQELRAAMVGAFLNPMSDARMLNGLIWEGTFGSDFRYLSEWAVRTCAAAVLARVPSSVVRHIFTFLSWHQRPSAQLLLLLGAAAEE